MASASTCSPKSYGANLPKLSAWEQWGLFIAIGVLVVIVVFASLF